LLIFKHFRPRIDRVPLADDRTLAGLVPPTLVIAGAQDAMLDSHDIARRLSEYAPNVDMRLLPDTDHHLPGQAGTVLDFLTGSAHQNAQRNRQTAGEAISAAKAFNTPGTSR
jgi:pimeloyl-ACP methyl ester carboxylesterase